MSVDKNLAIVDAYIEAVNHNNWDALNRLYEEFVVVWASSWGADARKTMHRDEIHANSDRFYAAWPDTHLEKVQMFGVGEWVCVEAIFTAIHKGTVHLAGGPSLPPTGKKIRSAMCLLYRIQDGRITHALEYYDTMDWWRQLGVDAPKVPVVMDVTKPVEKP